MDRLEKPADGNLVEFNTANTKSCVWDGLMLFTGMQGPTGTAQCLERPQLTRRIGPSLSRGQTRILPHCREG